MTSLFDLFATLNLDSSNYEAGLNKAATSATSTGSKIGGALKTIGKVGAVALTAATGAVTAFAKTAVSAGLSFDSAMGEVAATAGKTAEQMEGMIGSVDTSFGHFEGTMRDFAKFMGKNTAFSATQAAQALNYMALAGYDTQKSMEMLPAVLDMAAAGSMDLARASDMITDTQSALGLSTERTRLMVDEFAKAAATGNTSVEQLGEAFLTVGGLAKNSNEGLITLADGTQAAVDGTQQLEIAFTAMANAGIKGSEAGTHMRNMLLKLANPTSDGTKALEAMGVAVFDDMGKMRALNDIFADLSGAFSTMSQQEKLSIIGDLFNARDTASAEALLSAVGSEWDRIGESILQAKGSAAEMAATKLDNLQGDITKFKSALEGARITISDGLVPNLRSFVQFGTEGLSKLTTAFEEGGMSKAMDVFGSLLEDGLTMIFDKADLFLEAGGKLIGALGKGIVKNLPKLLEAGKTMLIKLADGMLSNLPALTTQVYAIVDKIVKLFDDPETIRQLTLGAANIIVAIAKGLANNASAIVDAAWTIITTLGEALIDALPQLRDVAVDMVRGIMVGLEEHLPELGVVFAGLQIAFEAVTGAIQTAFNLIKSFLGWLNGGSVGANVLKNSLIGVASAIGAIIVALKLYQTWTTIVAVATKGWAAVQGVLNAVMAANPIGIVIVAVMALVAAITMLWNNCEEFREFVANLGESLKNIVSAVGDWFVEKFTNARDNIEIAWENIKDFFTGIWDGIKGAFASVGEWFGEIFSNARDNIYFAWENTKEFFDGIWKKIKDAFKLGDVFQWGKDMIQNFKDGLMSKWEDLKSGVKGIAEGIKSFLGFSEPEEGPLSNFHTYAPDMIKLFVKGIKDNEGLLYRQLENTFDFERRMGDLGVIARDDTRVTVGGTVRIEGVNSEGEFVGASEYAIEEIITSIMKREARLA